MLQDDQERFNAPLPMGGEQEGRAGRTSVTETRRSGQDARGQRSWGLSRVEERLQGRGRDRSMGLSARAAPVAVRRRDWQIRLSIRNRTGCSAPGPSAWGSAQARCRVGR
jgi:hypothetical protein